MSISLPHAFSVAKNAHIVWLSSIAPAAGFHSLSTPSSSNLVGPVNRPANHPSSTPVIATSVLCNHSIVHGNSGNGTCPASFGVGKFSAYHCSRMPIDITGLTQCTTSSLKNCFIFLVNVGYSATSFKADLDIAIKLLSTLYLLLALQKSRCLSNMKRLHVGRHSLPPSHRFASTR